MAKDVVIATTATPKKLGAPTTYKPEYCELIIEFFLKPRETRKAPVAETEADGRWKREYKVICGELPSFSTFAESIKVTRQVLGDWRKRHPDFNAACVRAQGIAEAMLVERTNNGLYNAQFAQFYAKNVFGWKDKTEVETTTSADTDGMNHLKAMMQVATPEELTVIASLFERLEQRSLPAPADPTT